jgi:hypothetical protein
VFPAKQAYSSNICLYFRAQAYINLFHWIRPISFNVKPGGRYSLFRRSHFLVDLSSPAPIIQYAKVSEICTR